MPNENRAAAESIWEDWLVIETLGFGDGIEPMVIAKGARKRNFTRRLEPARLKVAVYEVVSKVADTGRPVVESHSSVGFNTAGAICGVPIFGPDEVVFGVQVWVGQSDTTPPQRQKIGSFSYDVDRQVTKHGPNQEGVVGVGGAGTTQTLQEIWRMFDRFDDEEAYREYLDALTAGEVSTGQEFAAEVFITGDDGIQRRINMSVRAKVDRRAGSQIVGLLHDTTELAQLTTSSDRQLARAAARLAAQDPEAGLGQIDLNTGIVFEWLKTPPPPFDQWETDNPELTLPTLSAIKGARAAIRDGSGEAQTIAGSLRFSPEGDWLDADFVVSPIVDSTDAQPTGRATRTALLQVGPAHTSRPVGMW